MQHWHQNRRPLPDHRFSALAPQLGGDQERVGSDDHGAEYQPRTCRLRERRNRAGGEPDHRAEAHRAPQHLTAVEQARRAPDHADRDEQQDIWNACRQRRRDGVTETPYHAGYRAYQISSTPPGERADAILHPSEQQKQPEQRGDTDGDNEKRSDVERQRRLGKAREHSSLLPSISKSA